MLLEKTAATKELTLNVRYASIAIVMESVMECYNSGSKYREPIHDSTQEFNTIFRGSTRVRLNEPQLGNESRRAL